MRRSSNGSDGGAGPGGQGEVRVLVFSVKLDESRLPWATFHSHVVGCSEPSRLEATSVRGKVQDTPPLIRPRDPLGSPRYP